jgi:hypothetical protein
MSLKTVGKSLVEEVPYGMYVWECVDGEVAGDGDGNVMNVFCMKGDRRAIDAITQAAKHYGIYEGGKAVWKSGVRRITDEQLEEQEARGRMGLVPDPLDYGAIKDAERARYNNRK